MSFKTIFFDLDDTIYPYESGLWEAIKARISLYMHEKLNISWDEIPARREEYYLKYGTTLRGLKVDFPGLDDKDYHRFVHDLPLNEFLKHDPNLTALLDDLQQRKFIFTSADAGHAERVLTFLGIREYFEDILDIYALIPFAKPQPEAFQRALELVGEKKPSDCMIIDDLPRTTRAARDFGLFSVLKGNKGNGKDANAQIQDWAELSVIIENS